MELGIGTAAPFGVPRSGGFKRVGLGALPHRTRRLMAVSMPDPEFKDCVVIGTGPAGLTAALYLNRFHRNVTVLDAGNSRARWIPQSRNYPGGFRTG